MITQDVLVIGGGISGLATAQRLAHAGANVALWEASTSVGGKIVSDQSEGYTTERAANMVMNFQPEVRDFLDSTGPGKHIAPRAKTAATNRYLVKNGRLVSIPTRLGTLFASPVFSWKNKLRMLVEPLIPKGDPRRESVSAFISRRLGRQLLENAMEPFVSGTLASDPDRANAAATLPRMAALEQRYGSIGAGIICNKLLRRRTAMQAEVFSFKGGMQTLTQTLTETLGRNAVCTQHRVTEIMPLSYGRKNDGRKESGWQIRATTPEGECCARVKHLVLAVPAPVAAKLLAPINCGLQDLLEGIEYSPLSVVHMGFDRSSVPHPLNGPGFLVPRREGFNINGNLWMSSSFADRAPTGKVLMTAYIGGMRNPAACTWDDSRTRDAVRSDLRTLMGIRAEPEFCRIDRHHQALPLYFDNYPKRCEAIAKCLEQLPGLHIEANYIGGVSVRDRLERSRTTAMQIINKLQWAKSERRSMMPGVPVHAL